ncbi:Fe(3+)-hydroxamate ABC transporter permease FhuB [Shimwellia pseudoproteus]|uniref:Fe(3+)-hydroxamate ABC transporter permease FhuB n=1 Tax=Shimwellia pseudoproteus TaxID=570012 RepID=UPI0018EBA890|nr:Fe(3+)-hydroxamate ABC transporter permease FhuB [Shimwellia pseudoproteus]MBJ3813392.1 Fe(3+)-hydroxamate ABC transporter permease FhuB [Shimwellia pseudoproteus]
MRTPRLLPVLLPGLLLAVALWLTLVNLRQLLPASQWLGAWASVDPDDIRQMLFYYSALPRLAISLLVGAGLGMVGVLFQQVLRNPLAEPTTLGVASGAQLGLTVATLWALPGGAVTQQFAAIAGSVVVGLLVFGVAWGKRLSPVTLILAGLVLSLYCGAINQLLALFHNEQLQSVFLWSTGSLNQSDWQQVQNIWPRLLGGVLLTLVMLRPLTLMGLDDGVARNLGLALSLARVATLGLAIFLSAVLVNAVGIVGFIGLFSPLLAKMLGARRLLPRLLLASLLGALILWVSDQLVVWLTTVWREITTGAVTALIGAPLLLWLLPRLRTLRAPVVNGGQSQHVERQHLVGYALLGSLLLVLVVLVALTFGRDASGWRWAHGEMLDALLYWRWPRVAAALSAGMMLAVAGCIIQRLTGNAMASPEVVGISSGAAFGIVVMLFIVPGNAIGWLLPAGSIGAAATLLIIMIAAGRSGFSPQRMLLAGMAISTAFSMLLMLLLASGDPRMAGVLTWISGSTYNVAPEQATVTLAVMVVLLGLTPLFRRWLMILPLGGATAQSVGVAINPSRMMLLCLAAVLTAMATLTVGPLSFVGLMAPHIARMMGFRRALPQLVIAALIGGGLMVVADWCGRMVLFPNQIPAGLLASFLGAPYFIVLLRRQNA